MQREQSPHHVRQITDRNFVTGELPQGCQLCLKGAKAIVFVTGLCNVNPPCYYCPVSLEKRGLDASYCFTNEKKTQNLDEIIAECIKMDAEGASLSGGDPLTKFNRSVQIINDLKSTFGNQFHIHLYTTGLSADSMSIKALYDAGLDEIRFHTVSEITKNVIQMALKFPDWKVGVEIPVIPCELDYITNLIGYLDEIQANFINLNELEISESNYRQLFARGLVEDKERPYAVEGSEQTAKKALEWGLTHIKSQLAIHYCSASTKDGVQLKNRLIRTANRIAQPYHEITEDGLFIYGIIEPKRPKNSLRTVARLLQVKFRIPKKLVYINSAKNRIETRWVLFNYGTSKALLF